MRILVSKDYWMYGLFPHTLKIEVGLTDEEAARLKPDLAGIRRSKRTEFIEQLVKEHFFKEEPDGPKEG